MTISPHVKRLIEEIQELCSPEKIYLYNAKFDLHQQMTSFKICLVVDTKDKAALERRIYLELDCDLPYDFVLYTPEEWEACMQNPYSFAVTIREKGVLLYDQAET